MNRCPTGPLPARAWIVWLLLALWPLHAWTAAVGVVRGVAHVHAPAGMHAATYPVSRVGLHAAPGARARAEAHARLHAADGRGIARFADDYAIVRDRPAVGDAPPWPRDLGVHVGPTAHEDHGPLSDHHHARGTHGVILVADDGGGDAGGQRLFARSAASLTDVLAEPVAIVAPSHARSRPAVAPTVVPRSWHPPPIERPPR
ncbi:MAG: hypothetical protein AB7P21_19055 [Lautropia sp.]